jgi:hypothetical protein
MLSRRRCRLNIIRLITAANCTACARDKIQIESRAVHIPVTNSKLCYPAVPYSSADTGISRMASRLAAAPEDIENTLALSRDEMACLRSEKHLGLRRGFRQPAPSRVVKAIGVLATGQWRNTAS